MNKLNNKNKNKGFSLIEVLLSVVIIALVAAPFLSSFVSANSTNAKSKKMQDATNLCQYLTEEFEGTTLNKLFEVYRGGDDTVEVDGSYIFNITNDYLFDSYNDDFTAQVKLTPSASPVNSKVTPKFGSIDNSKAAVFMRDFYRYDSAAAGADRRKVTIEISYDPLSNSAKPYLVKCSVAYYGSTGNLVLNMSDISKLNFAVIPDLYMMYTPFSNNDEVYIQNDLPESQCLVEGKAVSTYLILQEDYTNNIALQYYLDSRNVYVGGVDSAGNRTALSTLDYLQRNDATSSNTTEIFTNVSLDPAFINLVDTEEKVTLYDMEVTVNYDGVQVAKYTTTKNCIN